MAETSGRQKAEAKNWMFCPYSGGLLQLSAEKNVASSSLSGYAISLTELEDKIKIVQETDMDDYVRRYNLEPLVKTQVQEEEEDAIRGRKRATVDECCPKCGHQGMEFYTLQLRSADEGQTVFYECMECGHKYSQNN